MRGLEQHRRDDRILDFEFVGLLGGAVEDGVRRS